ncbi:type III secretion protein [Pseudomonas asuensis]|uniref:type III secretion protein n=1 Tax=Pseudomonas asuensis TaxID=1825787 RepID=UPI00166A3069|nr:type III secretion protein [Pseudomonas asuensis]
MLIDTAKRWTQWWCNAWEEAHPTWKARFSEQVGLPLSICEQLAQHRCEAFMSFAEITTEQPPEPDDRVLQWLTLNAAQNELALMLVDHICSSGHSDLPTLDEHDVWCRSVAKALRPGLWLHGHTADPRLLLGVWLGVRYWPRLRLYWPLDSLSDLAGHSLLLNAAAVSKLQTLWPAVLWRVTALNPPETVHAG